MSAESDPLATLAGLEGVPRAVAATRAAIDNLLRRRGHRRLSAAELTACRLTGARAAAELSGDADRWFDGALRLSAELDQLATTARSAPGQALARGHVLLTRGLVEDAALGRLRDSPDVAARVRGLGGLLSAHGAASGLVTAALVHAEIATVRPFGVGDDLLALAFERVAMIGSGVDPYGVVAVEAGHRRRRADHAEALAAYATGRAAGVRTWILHCLAAVVDGVEETPLTRA